MPRRDTPALERLVRDQMAAAQVQGLALAIIDDGRVSYVNAFGFADAKSRRALTPRSVMYGASLTKAFFAVLVMELVEQKRLDLDQSISEILPRPLPEYEKYADLAGDERWKQLTLRMLLNHTSGFQNFRWIDDDKKLRFHRNPGEQYGYSGEGINLAQLVVEEGLHLDVGVEMEKLFSTAGMTRTSLKWRDDFADDLANEHTASGEMTEHRHRGSVRAAGSMDTTIDDASKFIAALMRDALISRASRAEMTRKQIAIDTERQFPTLRSPKTGQWKAIQLGYGVGWGTFSAPQGHAFFKEGHDDGTANYVLCVDEMKRCVVLMANDVRAEKIFRPIIETVMGPVPVPWAWEGYVPSP